MYLVSRLFYPAFVPKAKCLRPYEEGVGMNHLKEECRSMCTNRRSANRPTARLKFSWCQVSSRYGNTESNVS